MRNTIWRSFKTAAWLGWQIESNWTDPLLFALYSIIAPLAVAGILVVLYALVTHADFSSPLFAYMYVGNAFYIYVGSVMAAMAYAVADDRERYQTLRSIYVAPVDVRYYLVGRGVARFLTASISVAVTLAFGILFLHLRIHAAVSVWPLLLLTFAMGLVMLAAMGLLLSGLALLLPDSSWTMGEAVAGVLYLFTGAIFPIDVLPRLLQPIAYSLAPTYWLELLRRCLLGDDQRVSTFARFSNLELLGDLAGLTLLLVGLALAVFRTCDYVARERGLIDRTTGH